MGYVRGASGVLGLLDVGGACIVAKFAGKI